MRLDFIVTGAPKSGTTYIDDALRRSQGIALPSEKETNYFCSEKINPTYGWSIKSEQEYYRCFLSSTDSKKPTLDRLYGEVCPSYFYFSDRIINHFRDRDAPIFIMLRDPLRRAISHYFMDRDRFGNTLPPPKIALTDPSATPYGAWGTSLNSFIDLSDYQSALLSFQQASLNFHILRFESGLEKNVRNIAGVLDTQVHLPDRPSNEQRRLRSPLISHLLRSRWLKSSYAMLGERTRKIVKGALYQPVDLERYRSEANECYAELSGSKLWKELITSYAQIIEKYTE
ncbi:hypothetical protein [Pelagibacterium lacus]|uniref:hypothetical protein n=1 Tax=Pelagibacterium lacus TaxID=2282655 RepID=UPI0011C072DF|nr:hypothetical protein [Pelagibacterium lacus]